MLLENEIDLVKKMDNERYKGVCKNKYSWSSGKSCSYFFTCLADRNPWCCRSLFSILWPCVGNEDQNDKEVYEFAHIFIA